MQFIFKFIQKAHKSMYLLIVDCVIKETRLDSVALVRERTIPIERPPPVGEVSANFCG